MKNLPIILFVVGLAVFLLFFYNLGFVSLGQPNKITETPPSTNAVPTKNLPTPKPSKAPAESMPGATFRPIPLPNIATADPNDKTPPVFGKMLNQYVLVNSDIDYLSGVTAKDNSHRNVTIRVDSGDVDLTTVGRYKVTYTAIDPSGNKSQAVNYLSVSATDPEKVMEAADQVLAAIVTNGMPQPEKAQAIHDWVGKNVGYVESSNTNDVITAAYEALRKKRGDCFSYYALSEVMLTRAGIPNQRIDRDLTQIKRSSHYWNLVNLGDGWMHFDTTPFSGSPAKVFMYTDTQAKQMDSSRGRGCYLYDPALYPEIVQ